MHLHTLTEHVVNYYYVIAISREYGHADNIQTSVNVITNNLWLISQ